MQKTSSSEQQYVLISVVEFGDDTLSVCPLQYGDLELCQRVMHLIPAVSINTDKKIKESWCQIITVEDFDARWQQGVEDARNS